MNEVEEKNIHDGGGTKKSHEREGSVKSFNAIH